MPYSGYLRRELRLLYDVCRQSGRDQNGTRCPVCALRDLCDEQLRQKGRRRETPRDGAGR